LSCEDDRYRLMARQLAKRALWCFVSSLKIDFQRQLDPLWNHVGKAGCLAYDVTAGAGSSTRGKIGIGLPSSCPEGKPPHSKLR
jgi:hypothetical protein